MNFTPEEIAIQRAFFARAHPTDRYPLWFDITEWEQVARTTHADALTVIELQREEIERLREALDSAADAVASVVACCTYGSEEQAKHGAYGISHEAVTKIDFFMRNHTGILKGDER